MLNKSIVLLFLGLFFLPSSTAAEEDDEDFVRVVVLGKSDLETFREELRNFDAQMDIRGQTWFLKKVKSRGIRPKKLFKRRKDLTYILEITETDFVFTVSKKSKSEYSVKIYDQGGEVVEEILAKGDSKGINATGAAEVISVYSTLLPEEKAEETVEDPVEEEKSVEIEEKKEDPPPSSNDDPSSNLSASIAAGVLKRDFEVDSPGGALLTYNSNFYPGAQLDLAYLFGKDGDRPGVFLRAIGGLDSVAFEINGERQESSLLQIDAEIGGFLRAETTNTEIRLIGGLRHTRFQIEDSALPTTSYSTLNLGADFLFVDIFPKVSLGANVSFTPFGLFHDGATLFGESSFIYGFGAGLSARYGLSDSLYVLGNFQMRSLRVSFSGKGESDFSDSYAFDFTQNVNLGVGLTF